MNIKYLYFTLLYLLLTNFCFSQTDGCGAGSTVLTPGAAGAACTPVAGSTTAAFTDSNQGCTAGNENDDGFYQFVATSTSHTITIDGAANFDAVIGAYNTCGGTQPTGGTCVDATGGDGIETLTLSGLTIGNTYFISVHDFVAPASGGFGDFTICITTPNPPPANDLCAGAIVTACAGTYTGSTADATSASDPSTLCGATPDGNGVWYVFAGDGNIITASLCGSSYDTEINVYAGSCASLTCIDGNDDFCGTSSEVTFTSSVGINYYILVNGFGGASGNYTLAITCTAPPVPTTADCAGGTTVCTDAAFVGNSSGSGNVVDLTSSNDGCLSGETQSSWYYFAATTAGTISLNITPSASDDYDFAIWGPGVISCPPIGTPLRCSYALGAGITGINTTAAPQTTEGAGGDGFVDAIYANAGDQFVLVVDNFSGSSFPFTLDWTLTAGATLGCTPLPVELINFNAIINSNKVDITWSTASELNNDYFSVERSKDGVVFEEVVKVDGAGNSTSIINYFDVDYHPIVGVSYYRLKQRDFNGVVIYSSIVPVRYQPNGNFGFSLFPNPGEAKDIKIELTAAKGQNILVVVRDIAGREFYSKVFVTETDGNKIEAIDTENTLAPGIYMVTASSNDAFYSQKLVIKK